VQAYIAAEVLAIPAVALTASSGYLFGAFPGALLVLVSATIAASISFAIGRTLLRAWAEKIIAGTFHRLYAQAHTITITSPTSARRGSKMEGH
jgi:uncharacterized membrane protein YdjX (TVP38/TMEM64 family)